MSTTKVLVSGGCGFIGHHLVEHFLRNTDWGIVVFDKLTYASNGWSRVKDIDAFDDKRVDFYTVDIGNYISEGVQKETSDCDFIIHLAAETHVDRSIENPIPFVQSNVMGTARMLDFACQCKNLKGFVMFSTDEVFGPAPPGVAYKEWDRYNCTNPYSATKAGAEQLALAYMNTYGIPGFITHTMNVFGERQHPEKFIPLCIRKLRNREKITIHADKTRTKAGTRFYIHARNVANAIHFLLTRFDQREIYNIVGEEEIDNLSLMLKIAEFMGVESEYEMVDFHSSRPGHDLRYALDGSKMEQLGWTVPVGFSASLEKTVRWLLDRPKWLEL